MAKREMTAPATFTLGLSKGVDDTLREVFNVVDDNFDDLYNNGSRSSSPTAGIGYKTGAGGTVTQLVSKATGVTLSKICGTITTHDAELADATTVTFAVTNTTVAATDVVVCSPAAPNATAGAYIIWANEVAAGSFSISIRNVSGGAKSEAIPINFVVVKGVAA